MKCQLSWVLLCDYWLLIAISCLYVLYLCVLLLLQWCEVTIPDAHLADDAIIDEYGFWENTDIGGPGIPNADLVVYVTSTDDSCGENTLAWALSCARV